MYKRKTKDVWKILYFTPGSGYGWEEIDQSETKEDAQFLFKEYTMAYKSCDGILKIKKSRVKI